MDLHDRVALVTGGAHRVGRAIALALAAAGMRLVIHYRSAAAEAEATLTELAARGVAATSVSGDVADVAAAEQVVDAAAASWNRLDLLVCSAGAWQRTPLGETAAGEWDQLFAVNARAPYFMAQRAAPHLRAAGGCIINIADVGIEWGWRGYTPYLASKAAVAMVTQNLAHDLAPAVRVNAVAPGPVLLPADWTPAQHERAAQSTLLKRVGRAEDVAEAVVFLARADYITGVVLPVDGGQRLT